MGEREKAMNADEREKARAFLRAMGAKGIAVEGWDGTTKASGRKPEAWELEELKAMKPGILSLFAWLEANAPERHGLVSAPDVYPWELRIDWAGGLPMWMGAWERAEAVKYACWQGGYGFQPETPEQSAFVAWIRWWVDARAKLLIRALGVDSDTATAMAAVDLVGWQFKVDRASAFERCKKMKELLEVQQEMRKQIDEKQ